MSKFLSLLGLVALLVLSPASWAEPIRFQCVGEFNFSDGEGEGFDGAYRWSFFVDLYEAKGVLVSSPMFPDPVSVSITPTDYRAVEQGEWCFKPYGPHDHKDYCAVGSRTLQIDRSNLKLLFSYTPQEHGKPLGALRQGRCRDVTSVSQ